MGIRAFVVAMVCAASLSVWAAPGEDSSAAEAKRHYEQGLVHYNLREYPQAASEFEAAYRLKPDPVFLYNLAQAYRLGDQPENALHFYRVYLQNAASAPNRREVEARIASLEQVVAEHKRATDEAARARTAPPTAPLSTTPPPQPEPAPKPEVTPPAAAPTVTTTLTDHPRKPVYKKWWLWTIVGVVAAGAAVGIAVGVTTQSHATFDASLGSYGPAALKGGN